MSILSFLRIAAAGSERPRPRKLAVESLERRAVMAVLDPLLESVVPPVETATPTQAAPEIVAAPEPLAEPIATGPIAAPVTEPIVVDPPPPVGTPPVITGGDYSRDGMWVTFTGSVQDDGPVAGLTIYFFTDTGLEFTTTVDADGTYNSHQVLIPVGTHVTYYTIDTDGNYSQYCALIV